MIKAGLTIFACIFVVVSIAIASKISYSKAHSYVDKKACLNMFAINATWGQFHQHFMQTILHAQIPKVQKDTDILNEFLNFWDLPA